MNQFVSLDRCDILWAVRRLPECVKKAMKREERNLMVAGGFLRSCISGEKVADVDLFVPTKERAEALALEIHAARENRGKPYFSENAWTVKGKPPIQIIHRWTFDAPSALLNSFDFSIACAVIWFEGEEFHGLADARFYPDLAAKRLRYCNPVREEEAGGSMLRVLKFYQRGYRIPLDSLGAVMARMVRRLDPGLLYQGNGCWNDPKLERVLTAMLIEVDPNMLSGSESAHLPPETEPESTEA